MKDHCASSNKGLRKNVAEGYMSARLNALRVQRKKLAVTIQEEGQRTEDKILTVDLLTNSTTMVSCQMKAHNKAASSFWMNPVKRQMYKMNEVIKNETVCILYIF